MTRNRYVVNDGWRSEATAVLQALGALMGEIVSFRLPDSFLMLFDTDLGHKTERGTRSMQSFVKDESLVA